MRSGLATFLLAALIASLLPAAAAGHERTKQAVLGGHSISLRLVSRYHCHDASTASVRCFGTAVERDRDLARVGRTQLAADSLLAVQYVTFYEHANYGGASYTTANPIANLGVMGWNDKVSSFTSLNGQRPRWWIDTNSGGNSHTWAAGASIWYVGDGVNDRFSSVADVG